MRQGNGMGWLRKIQRVVAAPGKEARRADAVRLRSEVIRLYREDRFAEAARVAQQLVDWQRNEIGEDHPDFARGLINLALILRKDGNVSDSIRAIERAAFLRRSTLGADHPDTFAADALADSWRVEDPPVPARDQESRSSIFGPTSTAPISRSFATQSPGLILTISELSESHPGTGSQTLVGR